MARLFERSEENFVLHKGPVHRVQRERVELSVLLEVWRKQEIGNLVQGEILVLYGISNECAGGIQSPGVCLVDGLGGMGKFEHFPKEFGARRSSRAMTKILKRIYFFY